MSPLRFRSASHSQCMSRGFTLVEMVTVIMILGVLVVGVSSFIIFGTRIFVESTSIDQVLGQSRFAIERMTRELRNALPNSIRVRANTGNWQCIEFVPIQASASYLTLPVAPDDKADTATGILPSQAVSNSQLMSVYPLTLSHIYADPAQTEGRIFDLKSVTSVGNRLTLEFDRNIRFSEASPLKRYFLVNQPVSYCIENRQLTRYTNYGINHGTQRSPSQLRGISGATWSLMAEDIVNDLSVATDMPFSVVPATLVNNAMIQIQPEFEVVGERFRYQHQVQVVNVP